MFHQPKHARQIRIDHCLPVLIRVLNGRRAERVRRAQQHRMAFGLQVRGQLADRRGFPRAVHANDHNNGGGLIDVCERPVARLQDPARQSGLDGMKRVACRGDLNLGQKRVIGPHDEIAQRTARLHRLAKAGRRNL